MNLSPKTILARFPYVFKNEFNERKILQHVVDENWGKEISLAFVSNGLFVGTRWGVEKANNLRILTRTLVMTEDKNGEHQLFQFWHDFSRNLFCYSEIKRENLFVPTLRKFVK
jgi:hypothetical protein